MSKVQEYIKRLEKHGTTVTVINQPSTESKCSCWEYEWPDKDCIVCGGKGYIDEVVSYTAKAFIFPLVDSPKELDHMNIGVAIGGQVRAYFRPDVDLDSAHYVVWDGIRYRISDVDRAIVEETIIYRLCHMDKVD